MADDYSEFTGKSTDSKEPDSLGQGYGVVARGLLKAVPVYGEKAADYFNLPKPKNVTERTAERAATNFPYALPALITAPPVGVAQWAGSTLAGQTAEELGGGPITQAGAEILGGGLPHAVSSIGGKLYGVIDPTLKSLSREAAKEGYYVGPGARTRKGMSYGSAETAKDLERNLTRATEEATSRAGNPSKIVDEKWINSTQTKLGNEVERIFGNKVFSSTPEDVNAINQIISKAENAFGEQGNIVKSIIENNIKGERPSGKIITELTQRGTTVPEFSSFSAKSLRSAIQEVNAKLGSGSSPAQNTLLYDLKTTLENIAEKNLKAIDPKLVSDYNAWKNNYTAYATLRDLIERAGKSGIDPTGKINLSTLRDIVDTKFGSASNAIKNPLFAKLAEFSDVLRTAKVPETSGVYQAAKQTLKESPPSKMVMGLLQPNVGTKRQTLAKSLGVVGTGLPQLQITSSKRDPYSEFVGK